MKWIVIVVFAIAALSSLLWAESKERNYTSEQTAALLAISLVAWGLVVVLATVVT